MHVLVWWAQQLQSVLVYVLEILDLELMLLSAFLFNLGVSNVIILNLFMYRHLNVFVSI